MKTKNQKPSSSFHLSFKRYLVCAARPCAHQAVRSPLEALRHPRHQGDRTYRAPVDPVWVYL